MTDDQRMAQLERIAELPAKPDWPTIRASREQLRKLRELTEKHRMEDEQPGSWRQRAA